MADEADRALAESEGWRDEHLDQVRGKVPDPSQPGPECCPECGEPIPEKRRAMGYQTCTGCAE